MNVEPISRPKKQYKSPWETDSGVTVLGIYFSFIGASTIIGLCVGLLASK